MLAGEEAAARLIFLRPFFSAAPLGQPPFFVQAHRASSRERNCWETKWIACKRREKRGKNVPDAFEEGERIEKVRGGSAPIFFLSKRSSTSSTFFRRRRHLSLSLPLPPPHRERKLLLLSRLSFFQCFIILQLFVSSLYSLCFSSLSSIEKNGKNGPLSTTFG